MPETVTTTPAVRRYVLRMALAIFRVMMESYREWEEECEADHAAGYRAHYCEHGTNLWTDYDPICGPCEDGFTGPMARRRAALDAALGFHRDFSAFSAAFGTLHKLDREATRDIDVAAVMERIGTRHGVPLDYWEGSK